MLTNKLHLKNHKIAIILISLLLLMCVGSFIALHLLNVLNDYKFLYLIYAAVTPVLLVLLIVFIHNDAIEKKEVNERLDENFYQLGKLTYFADATSFKKHVNKFRKINSKNVERYFIIFVPTYIKDSNARTPYIRTLNGYISDYLVDLISKQNRFGKNKVAYGFARDRFCLYAYLPFNKVLELTELISQEIYSIVKTHELKLHITPHFGIVKVSRSDLFSPSFAKASVALEYAEQQFEPYALYEEGMLRETSYSELKALDNAIKRKEFVVYYQPKYNFVKKQIVGSEALIRWNSPDGEILSPNKFINAAEVGGMIHKIDMYVFDCVIEDLKEMKRKGIKLLPVSINFSLYEFYSADFVTNLERKIRESGLPISLFQIEITETTSQSNNLLANSILKKLKDYGFKILMDDFGTGYSNLLNLNTLPIDIIKIDKSYIDGCTLDKKNKEVLKYLVLMCKANGFETIAEGVEKEEQIKILQSINCEIIQGYYFSKPIPKDEYAQLIKEGMK